MSLDQDFETWWQAYPRRVGKLAAKQAYRKARTMASAQQLISGIEQYIKAKPTYADFCHPRTWLTQGRWLDELDATPINRVFLCPHVERCGSWNECDIKTRLGRP